MSGKEHSTQVFSFKILSIILFALAAVVACLGIFMIIHGYPAPHWLPKLFGTKSLKKTYQIVMILLAAGVLLNPLRRRWVDNIFQSLTRASQGSQGILILVAIYSILFLWNQLTSFWSIQINFMPFSFYDYMLYYFGLGKVNFTGLLHWCYHVNNILYILFPVWMFFKSSLVLVVLHGPLLALGALPLFLLTRKLFPKSWIPLIVAFFYLNFRFLLNLLEMDFLVESFYPLALFTAFYFLIAERKALFLLTVLLTLLVKEDAAFYLMGMGAFLLFVPRKRSYGLGAIIISALYSLFLVKVFLPWTENAILVGTANNYQQMGHTPADVLRFAVTQPLQYIGNLFWPVAKLRTHLKLLQFTFFLPLLSPWYLLVLLSVLPCFVQWNDIYANFVDLRFHYSAPVIPFVFLAFVMGLKNLKGWLGKLPLSALSRFSVSGENILRVLLFLLILINGGNYLSHRIEAENLTTIQKISEIPKDKILVTQGHLLPYAGYRPFNLYFSWPYERAGHPYHTIYENADYYFMARSVESYPYDKNWLEAKIKKLKKDPYLELVYDDGDRVLFKRKLEPYKPAPELLPLNQAKVQYERKMKEGGLS